MNIVTWNTEWAPPGSIREKEIKRIVSDFQPNIICITEGYLQSWEDEGYCICCEENYGYPIKEGRRKVILISQDKWEQVDNIGDHDLPPGRFVCGKTYNLDIYGVCIPWRDAHVRTGQRNKLPWEDHQIYLDYLKGLIDIKNGSSIVLGDFNQRIPRKYTPVNVHDKLIKTFKDNYHIGTSGIIERIGKLSIDHIATSKNMHLSDLKGISNYVNGIRVSDHFGIVCQLNME